MSEFEQECLHGAQQARAEAKQHKRWSIIGAMGSLTTAPISVYSATAETLPYHFNAVIYGVGSVASGYFALRQFQDNRECLHRAEYFEYMSTDHPSQDI